MRFIIAWLVLFCSSCACWSPAHRDEPTCRNVANVIDCSEKNIASRIPAFMPVVSYILSGAQQSVDWMQMITTLEGAGLGAVACAVERVRMDAELKDYRVRSQATMAQQPPVAVAAEEYLRTRNLRVKFALPQPKATP